MVPETVRSTNLAAPVNPKHTPANARVPRLARTLALQTAGHFNAMRAQIGFLTHTVIGVSAYVRENPQIQAADESFLRELAGR